MVSNERGRQCHSSEGGNPDPILPGSNGMSRSRKRRPYFAVGKSRRQSDKKDKRMTHKLFRHLQNSLLAIGEFEVLPLRHDEVMSEWDFGSDGPKTYKLNVNKERLRK